MHSVRFWNIWILLTLFGGIAFIAATRAQPNNTAAVVIPPPAHAEPAPLPDHPAPDFLLTSTSGEAIQLSDLRGQVVLINVWATWCPPCRAEMPAIQAVYDQYRDQGFVVLAINYQEESSIVTAYLAEQQLDFPTLLDQDGSVGAQYQARVFPSSFFIDRRGVIRAVYRGPMSRNIIAGTVEQLLSER